MKKDLFETYFEESKKEIVEDYLTFLRFPSIATDPAYKQDVERCAEWLSQSIKKMGLEVEKWESKGAPVLFAYDNSAGPDKETLLLYGHYDVQPVDPLEEWLSPPFEPVMKDGTVYARGAQDNKGQCFYTLTALRAFLKIKKKFPLNIKMVIEGEEESGSTALSCLLQEKKEKLKANYLVIVDSALLERDEPVISLGARGLVSMEVTVEEAAFDLHSGMVGGIAYNPNRALAEILAKTHDSRGSVNIPRFYDEVMEISANEKKELALDFQEEKFIKMFGFKPSGMESGLSPHESAWLRPTFEINGIWGGYTGQGFKTVVPKRAHAKISCRLVPAQDPNQIFQIVKAFFEQNTPEGLRTTVTLFPGGSKGFRTSPHSRIAKVMADSYTRVFKKECQKILIGGSIPISIDLASTAGAEMVLVGVGLPDDLIHAPNEHFDLDRFKKGFLTICHAIALFE